MEKSPPICPIKDRDGPCGRTGTKSERRTSFAVGAAALGGPRAAQVCRPYGFSGTVCENETVPLIRPLRGHLPLKGKAFGRLIAAPTEHTKDCPGNIVGAGPRPARQVWGNSRDTAGGAHPRVASFGLRPIHLQPLPYKITGALPDLGRGGPWASRQDSDRERWLRKLRRRSGTSPKADFANTGPLWARKKPHPSTPDFARRKYCKT